MVKLGARRRVREVGRDLFWGYLLGRGFCGSWHRICQRCEGGKLVRGIQVVMAGLGGF